MSKAQEATIEIPDIKRKRIELNTKCGECMFLTRYQTYGMPCEKFGTVPSSVPCARFTPDPSALGNARAIRDALRVLGDAKHGSLLASIMLGNRRVRRHGYDVGDVVYFRVLGEDYLGNYAHGVVTGATATKLVIMGAQGFAALITPTADVMLRDDFEQRRQLLVDRDRINDPAGGLRKISARGVTRLVAYEPPEATGTRKRRGPRSNFGGKKPRKTGPIVLSAGDQR